jgi:hypothetical protein
MDSVVPDLMDSAIGWVNPSYAVEPGTHQGYAGFAAAAKAVLSVYGDYRVSPVRFYEVGDRMAVRARVTGRSSVNDLPIDTERGYVFDIRDGKVVRWAWFNDPAEALKAVGLPG